MTDFGPLPPSGSSTGTTTQPQYTQEDYDNLTPAEQQEIVDYYSDIGQPIFGDSTAPTEPYTQEDYDNLTPAEQQEIVDYYSGIGQPIFGSSTAPTAPTAPAAPTGQTGSSGTDAYTDNTYSPSNPSNPLKPGETDIYKGEVGELNYDYEDSVEGRLAGILEADSPLMQLARTDANQAAAKKGLLNSSLAVGAAQEGVMRTALPIATSDATNANQLKALSFSAQQDLEKIAANISGDLRLIQEKGYIDSMLNDQQNKAIIDQIKLTGYVDSILKRMDYTLDTRSQELAHEQDLITASVNAEYQNLLQTNSLAAQYTNTHTQAITNVLLDPNMTSDQKNSAIAKLNQDWQAGLAIISMTSGLDYGDVVEFG
jgi:hypothetical protein